ncbi:Lyzozyme M1 (1,4-beta-N-acetylmuramidase), GH25 family [Polaromonas sp. YR568]|uniref:glycoside hydrolase family 25 protein n=1 Tax=Polaromonas sp. YR568 TaxID=1855301 RepID=UPI0008E77F7B|nr:GH25 family lysozyme [Polaromonas sp. YR568]SFU88408.1 Lyzozyme M1 (1,4-beta-N-acetylmuramidase), GH25 family [Polaromonas sp. YR568]
MPIPGIDVSHFQGAVDWTQVAGSGVAFCFMKATQGTGDVDPCFKDNWPGSFAAGLTRGAYHFGLPGIDAQAQAQFFFDTVTRLNGLAPDDLPPVLDIETANGADAQTTLQWVLDFTTRADKLFGRQTMIYTDNGFWQSLAALPGCAPLAARPLWIADYDAGRPAVPSPWQAWSCWQYSDDSVTGPGGLPRVPGINGPVDRDWFQSAAFQSLTTPSTAS